MMLGLELAGAFFGGWLTALVAVALVARRKMRQMQKMMQGFPFPQA